MNVREILAGLAAKSALVVGDICLDRWCTYDPATAEPSRETGIPRIGVVRTEVTPGAGGTVASNLAALGVRETAVLGVCGDDGFGHELKRALDQRGITSRHLVTVAELQTFTYTKVINGDSGVEDMPRLDFIVTRPLAPGIERRLADELKALAAHFDVILVSDQAETGQGGVVTDLIRRTLADLAAAHPAKVIWADSRMRPELFRGVIVKPNQQEAEAASLRALGRVDYQALRGYVRAPLLLVTHGGDGVLAIDDEGERWIKARKVENPVDICGAGDSFSAGAALALAVTGSTADAARFGNLVASITILKKGTGTASPAEILEASERA